MSTPNSTNANIPGGAPLVDQNGQITQVWYQFLLALFNRSGGGGTPTDITALQALVSAQGKEIDSQAIPLPYRPVQQVLENVALRIPPQSLMNESVVYAPPRLYAAQNTAVTFTTLRATLAAKVFAQNSSAQSIPNNTNTVVTGWTAITNIASAFNAATGVFTAPRAGQYLVSARIMSATAAWPAGTIWALNIAKNGTSLDQTGWPIAVATTVALRTPPVTTLVDCAAGDTITCVAIQNQGGAVTLNPAATTSTLSITELP